MAGILNQSSNNIRAVYLGQSGSGKTGSKAALICEGYKIRMMDTDKGARILYNLLTNPKFPYAALIKSRNIDLDTALDIIPIDLGMGVDLIRKEIRTDDGKRRFVTNPVIKPHDSSAWERAVKLLQEWKDSKVNYGSITTWGDDVILDIDAFTSLARAAYYWVQDINNHLGEYDGFSYMRDVGGAQDRLLTLLEMLYDSSIKCNIIVTTHVEWVDETKGFAQSPSAMQLAGKTPNPTGLPAAIGKALCDDIGRFFNDQIFAKIEGNRRRIYTVPTSAVSTKASNFLEPSYDISTGMAEIFAALKNQPPPMELIEAVKKHNQKGGTKEKGKDDTSPTDFLTFKP